jgi:hypothetical protein
MAMNKYMYEMVSADVDDNLVTTKGIIAASGYVDACSESQKDSFLKVTQGKAVFGSPGVGCNGPYTVVSFKLFMLAYGDQNV